MRSIRTSRLASGWTHDKRMTKILHVITTHHVRNNPGQNVTYPHRLTVMVINRIHHCLITKVQPRHCSILSGKRNINNQVRSSQTLTYAFVFRTHCSHIADSICFALPTTRAGTHTSGLEREVLLECSVVGSKGFCKSMPESRRQRFRGFQTDQRTVCFSSTVRKFPCC